MRGLSLGSRLPAQEEAERPWCWVCLQVLWAERGRERCSLGSAVPKIVAFQEVEVPSKALAEEVEGDALTQQGGVGEGVK